MKVSPSTVRLPAPSVRPVEVEAFEAIGWRLAAHRDIRGALLALTDVAAQVVPGARWVSVSRPRDGRLCTLAASDPVARTLDELQSSLGTGPSVDTARTGAGCTSTDLAADPRWPVFGPRAAADHGACSVMSTRLVMDTHWDFDPVMTLYADRVDAFDATACGRVALLAACAGVGVAAVVNREDACNLTGALASNREIGVAMGVLMATRRLTRKQAFDLLRVASQNSNRKLHDIAKDVADTGVLELPAVRTGGTHTRRSPEPPAAGVAAQVTSSPGGGLTQ